jgi:hypothetical protein
MATTQSQLEMNTGVFADGQTAGTVYGSCSGHGALRVAQVDQQHAELTRAGRRFTLGYSSAPTGIAPVTAIPTTAAQWVITNTSSVDTFTFDSLGVHLHSGTAAAGISVYACLFTAPAQSGFATGISAQSLSFSSTSSSSASVKSGVTVTNPAAPAWFLVAKSDSANTAVGAVSAVNFELKGGLMLPPGKSLGLATLSGTGTSPLFIPVATWTESEQDLE